MPKNRIESEIEDAGKFYKWITNQNNIILLYTILNFQGEKCFTWNILIKEQKKTKQIKNIS